MPFVWRAAIPLCQYIRARRVNCVGSERHISLILLKQFQIRKTHSHKKTPLTLTSTAPNDDTFSHTAPLLARLTGTITLSQAPHPTTTHSHTYNTAHNHSNQPTTKQPATRIVTIVTKRVTDRSINRHDRTHKHSTKRRTHSHV
jgi:hypothetical protein